MRRLIFYFSILIICAASFKSYSQTFYTKLDFQNYFDTNKVSLDDIEGFYAVYFTIKTGTISKTSTKPYQCAIKKTGSNYQEYMLENNIYVPTPYTINFIKEYLSYTAKYSRPDCTFVINSESFAIKDNKFSITFKHTSTNTCAELNNVGYMTFIYAKY